MALAGVGPAITPLPMVSSTISTDYVDRLRAASLPDDLSQPLESDEVAVVLATSGSMGQPKGVLLTAAGLTALDSVVNGANAQWIAALPLHSMGGFNVAVRALASGRDPIAVASLGGAQPFTSAVFADAVKRASGAQIHVSLVAAQLRRLLADEIGVAALQACALVLIGAGPLAASTRASAQDNQVHLVTSYGMTETSGGCVFDGRPLRGVKVESYSESTSTLVISGPMLATGYRLEPKLTKLHFTAAGFITSDHGTVDADGFVTILGRADDVININGVNVSAGAVEQVISDIPNVTAVLVLPIAGPSDETAIVAAVETSSTSTIEAVVKATVQQRLGPAAVPCHVIVQTELPMLPNGKVDREVISMIAMQSGRLPWQR
jgi:O-succinylbenzoic acid--CoA ligase